MNKSALLISLMSLTLPRDNIYTHENQDLHTHVFSRCSCLTESWHHHNTSEPFSVNTNITRTRQIANNSTTWVSLVPFKMAYLLVLNLIGFWHFKATSGLRVCACVCILLTAGGGLSLPRGHAIYSIELHHDSISSCQSHAAMTDRKNRNVRKYRAKFTRIEAGPHIYK